VKPSAKLQWETLLGNLVGKPCGKPCWDTLLGYLVGIPCWDTLLGYLVGIPCWDTLLGYQFIVISGFDIRKYIYGVFGGILIFPNMILAV